jgi:uncharacterized protein (DUF1697 family)
MVRQIALLRGINVGGHNKVGMAQLRDVLGELGFARVRTHLQSGNVVFDAGSSPEESARVVESVLAEKFGVSVPVLVRGRADFARVVDENPWHGTLSDPAKFLVVFLAGAPDPEVVRAVRAEGHAPDVFELGRREIYLWCPNGLRETTLSPAFWERRLGLTATGRNGNTVTKLCEIADA